MGIDPIRFANEFAKNIGHVHAKDTEIDSENLYEYGSEQPAALRQAYGFGAWAWRYTIPGHGQARWTTIF